jgi:ABC-type polysaccharide/polyol phosphate export permease
MSYERGITQSRQTALAHDVREMVSELVEYRDLLFQMTWRDLLIRYKQAVMGFGWAVFMPVTNAVIFSVIFTRVSPLQLDVPYPVYVYAGLVPWNFFASALKFSMTSLTSNSNLLTKIYFPREVLPFSAVLVALVDFLVAGSVMGILMMYYGIGVSWTLLFLPLIVAVQVMFTAGMALALAMGNLFLRDVKYLSEVVIMVWMFATSVVYPVDRIGGNLGLLLKFNPMTPIIDAYRSILLRNELPAAGPFLFAAGASLAVFVIGWISFHRAEFEFAENI